jgi:predicted dehydrogenase
MIRIGLVGFGHLGRIHLKVLQDLPGHFSVVGVYDHNKQRQSILYQTDPTIEHFSSYEALLPVVDAIGIIASTPAHFALAAQAITLGKSVFIEKPICTQLSDALQLEKLLLLHPVVLQVGHVERFNPVLLTLVPRLNAKAVHYFKAWRTAPFQQRGADVSVVLDLMIHDIDLLLTVYKDTPTQIEVEAKQDQSKLPDEVLAKLTFADGRLATLFASRITEQRKRTIDIKVVDTQYSLDLLGHQLRATSASGEQTIISIEAHNALRMQWLDFSRSIVDKIEPKVDVHAGINALRLALEIESLAQHFIAIKSTY